MTQQPDVWLRGPISGISLLLQPVAHALLQTVEDVERAARDLPPTLLWTKPGGAASVGFHLLHLAGALDRLFTYARAEPLNSAQRERLALERSGGDPATPATTLIADIAQLIERCLDQLRNTSESSLTDPRAVGAAGYPSSVLGLLFHGAEHAQRHAGQIVTTARFVRAIDKGVLPRRSDASLE